MYPTGSIHKQLFVCFIEASYAKLAPSTLTPTVAGGWVVLLSVSFVYSGQNVCGLDEVKKSILYGTLK